MQEVQKEDWAEMLYRMYSMWAESKGFKFNVIDFQSDEAGLKDCTVEISGDYAYGLLQAEIGIHRLVKFLHLILIVEDILHSLQCQFLQQLMRILILD